MPPNTQKNRLYVVKTVISLPKDVQTQVQFGERFCSHGWVQILFVKAKMLVNGRNSV